MQVDAARVLVKEAHRRRLSVGHFIVASTLVDACAFHKKLSTARRATTPGWRRTQPPPPRDLASVNVAAAPRTSRSPTQKLGPTARDLSESRHDLIVNAELTEADCYTERQAALAILERSVIAPATVGADRAYDTRDFVWNLRALGQTPHVAPRERGRRSAIDRRTIRHPGYAQSQRRRKLVEELSGWIKRGRRR